MRADEPSGQLGYQPSLDGMRGIAVTLVVLDHANVVPFLGWGQIGVTLFFVLSGFLITTLLLEEKAKYGKIDLRAFYIRRALRLLPALLVLLAGVSLMMALSGRTHEIAVDVLSTLFYVRNWFTAMGENPGLLSHAWSLSIEEQFYIAWPAAFIGLTLIWKGGWTRMAAALLVVALGSWLLRIVIWESGDYNRTLWGTDTRLDAILIGCAVALARWRWPIRVPWPAGVLALAVVALTGWVTDDSGLVRWGLVAVSLAGVVIILASIGSRFLAWRPLVFVGVISYGLYLYHRPIARVFVDWGLGGDPIALVAIAALSVSLALASYRYLERPALLMKERLGGRPVSGLAGVPVVVSEEGSRRER